MTHCDLPVKYDLNLHTYNTGDIVIYVLMTCQTDQLKFTVVWVLYLMSHLLVPISNQRIHVMLFALT